MIYVYGREGCASCESKKIELSSKNIPYKYVDVDALSDTEVEELLLRNSGVAHLPIVEEKDE